MYRNTKRFHQCQLFKRQIQITFIDIAFRNDDIFCHCTITVYPDDHCIVTNIRMTIPAQITGTAYQMGVRVHNITNLYGFHIFSDLYNNAGIFVTNDRRWIHSFLCIIIPMFDMYVRTTNGNCFYTDQYVIITNFRDRFFSQNDITVPLLFLYNTFHHFHICASFCMKTECIFVLCSISV